MEVWSGLVHILALVVMGLGDRCPKLIRVIPFGGRASLLQSLHLQRIVLARLLREHLSQIQLHSLRVESAEYGVGIHGFHLVEHHFIEELHVRAPSRHRFQPLLCVTHFREVLKSLVPFGLWFTGRVLLLRAKRLTQELLVLAVGGWLLIRLHNPPFLEDCAVVREVAATVLQVTVLTLLLIHILQVVHVRVVFLHHRDLAVLEGLVRTYIAVVVFLADAVLGTALTELFAD